MGRNLCRCVPSILVAGVGTLLATMAFAQNGPQNGDPAAPVVTIGTPERICPPAVGTPRDMPVSFIGVGVPPEGDGASDVVFTPDGTKFIVAHRDSMNLVIFDAATRVVVNAWPLSGSPNALAVTPNGQTVVTANLWEDTASIVNLATGAETVVSIGDQPGSVRITPDGAVAIVFNSVESTLSVIDIASATELRRLTNAQGMVRTELGSFAINYDFTDFRITPDSATVIFPDWATNEIKFFTIATGAVNVVPCTVKPMYIDMTPDGSVAVVGHDTQLLISKIDVASQTITAVIPTGGPAGAWPVIAINPSGTKAAVAVLNAVRVVDLQTQALSAALNTGSATGMRTTADGQYALVGNYLASVISYASGTIVGGVTLSHYPDNMAVSPTGPRAAFVNLVRDEMQEVLATNGSGAHLEGTVPTGPIPEGDKARNVAVSSDGHRAVVLNNHSWNATIFDLQTNAIEHVAACGERPGAVGITPDDNRAVVANLDAYFATVIDLSSGNATNISMGRRGSQVAISPNGQYAYIPVVADGDGVYRINLNTLSLEGSKLSTGDMGGIGAGVDQSSGIALSHDGATLVTAGSFTNNISIINTGAWSESIRLPVGTFPVSVVFHPNDSKMYVANKNSNTVSVVTNAGAGSAVIATIPVGQGPWQTAIMPDGSKLYVGNYTSKTISVVDLTSYGVIQTIPIPAPGGFDGQPMGLRISGDGTKLMLTASGAYVHRIDPATDAIVDTVNTGVLTADLAWSDARDALLIAGPLGSDGLFIVSLSQKGDLNCDGVVDTGDVAPFVLALLDPAGYAAQYPDCDVSRADVNVSGTADGLDIQPFVDLLLAP